MKRRNLLAGHYRVPALAFLATWLVLGVAAYADSPIFTGDYLHVGVSNSGGLIDDGFNVGIGWDKTGTSTWSSLDYLKPGSPFEFYSIGVDGTWNAAGYENGNTFGATTTNTSAGSTNSAVTTGSYGNIAFTQTLSYAKTSGTIDFQVQFTNTGDVSHELVYARGLDPDQDSYVYGSSYTDNAVVNGNLVKGSGPYSDWTIGIFSDSEFAHTPTVDYGWDQNPYDLLIAHDDGNGDYTINMAWDLGTLAPGASATLAFQYRIAETSGEVINPGVVPLPAGVILGALGLSVAGWRLKRKTA